MDRSVFVLCDPGGHVVTPTEVSVLRGCTGWELGHWKGQLCNSRLQMGLAVYNPRSTSYRQKWTRRGRGTRSAETQN